MIILDETTITQRRDEIIARLLAHREIDPVTGCWVWTAGNRHDYGSIAFYDPRDKTQKNYGVHRVAAMIWLGLAHGDKRIVLHKCDNPPCFNPDGVKHLVLGTHYDNHRDKSLKGRHWEQKRTPEYAVERAERVLKMVEMARAGLSQKAIGAAVGLSAGTVSQYLKRAYTEENAAVAYTPNGHCCVCEQVSDVGYHLHGKFICSTCLCQLPIRVPSRPKIQGDFFR